MRVPATIMLAMRVPAGVLLAAPAGAYCLRVSSDPTVLTVICVSFGKEMIGHFRVRKCADGARAQVEVLDAEGLDARFASVYEAIAFLKTPAAVPHIGVPLQGCVASDTTA